MHLMCNLGCGWISSHSSHVVLSISEYLAHVINEHWEVLEYAHNNPDALAEMLAVVKEEICSN